jgi:hypothetical protein
MKRVLVFLLLILAGGVGGMLGSILGNAFGKRGLFVGGFIGGVIVVGLAAWLAGRLRWIPSGEVAGTAVGAMAGFVIAATIAVNTLSSPVGPVLSTLCVGLGGLAGGKIGANRRD